MVGAGVTDFTVGDAVFGVTDQGIEGAYAEKIAINAAIIAKKPIRLGHDLEEALAMSDRIVVMRDGLVEQTGTPDEIYSLPRSEFVADFIGSANLIRGRHRPDLDGDGLTALETATGQLIYGMAYGRMHRSVDLRA